MGRDCSEPLLQCSKRPPRRQSADMPSTLPLRTIAATRYVTPLREGGSLPAIVEGDDDGLYVLKFRGAGQGPKALVAELVCGEIARALGLAVPELVFMRLDAELARTEPDPEIQDLIRASAGLNVALDFLPGAVNYDPLADCRLDPGRAAEIVWLDALVSNIDRSARNPNLLCWHGRVWLIDHGAAFIFHHAWDGTPARAREPFLPVRDHVLLSAASSIADRSQMPAVADLKALDFPAIERTTLKNGIETLLKHYVPEVTAVHAI